jgi:hypothetical protein
VTPPLEPSIRRAAPRPPQAWTDFDRLSQQRENDPKIIGPAVLLTLLLHGALFFWVLPWLGTAMQMSRVAATEPARIAPPPVEYVLAPATPADQQALRYMETNPNAPVAKPDATNNISNRDQRAAQTNPNPNGHSDKPKTDGQQLNSEKIVEGDLSRPAPAPTPPAPAKPEEQKTATAAQPTAPVAAAAPPALAAKAPATDGEDIRFEEKPPEKPADKPSDTMLPPTVAEAQPNPKLPPGPLTPDTVAESAATATPQVRENLAVKTHAGPLMMETQGTHNEAQMNALDAKFTPFGAYQAMMFDAIGSEWDSECESFSFNPRDADTAVQIIFSINSKGEVTDLQVVDSTATRGATLLCVNAIKRPAPYSPWSKEMVGVLGETTSFRVTFYYQ